MLVYPIKITTNKILSKITNPSRIIRKAAVCTALCTSALLSSSCWREYLPPQNNNTYINPSNVKENDDIILPDTVSQVRLQDINNIHEKINTLFQSLKIIEQGKNIQDVQTLEFEDSEGNLYKYTDIQKTNKGYEFTGTVNHNGIEENTFIKFSDAYELIENPLICMETSFNKKHNLSMIYQNHWRLGENRKPERRIFQNRTNKYVDRIDPREYYPYDAYNVFAIRKTDDGISSKALNEKLKFTENDEIKNIKVTYK